MKFLLLTLAAALVSLAAAPAWANSDTWYVVPEDQGDCGDECYTPPMAWIDEPGGRYRLGVSCDSQLILGGRATHVSEITIGSLEMAVDGASLGRFAVETGLNDVYLQPTDRADQPPARTADRLASGQEVVLIFQQGERFTFTLGGARAAIALANRLCAE